MDRKCSFCEARPSAVGTLLCSRCHDIKLDLWAKSKERLAAFRNHQQTVLKRSVKTSSAVNQAMATRDTQALVLRGARFATRPPIIRQYEAWLARQTHAQQQRA